MAGYTIGDVAERSGFSASALRYYEDIDLVRPAGRTEAGYRLYDDEELAKLGFIARAKQLGCTLDEIRDLLAVWEGEDCRPVQRRLHELVTGKLADAHNQIADLTAFSAQLTTAATHLAGPAIDGPCGDDCACTAATATSVPVALSPRPATSLTCALEEAARDGRIGEWSAVLDHARHSATTTVGSVRVEFDDTIAVDELARLVAAEHACCAFLAFAITVDDRGIALEIDAPDTAAELLTTVFGPLAKPPE
jgi:MerR family transcriptional regulator, copper efflux regulator